MRIKRLRRTLGVTVGIAVGFLLLAALCVPAYPVIAFLLALMGIGCAIVASYLGGILSREIERKHYNG